MNIIVLPAMIGVILTGYIAIATRDYDGGQERIFAADSMIRHHELAVARRNAVSPPTLGQSIPVTTTPFVNVLDWDSALAVDNGNRLWMLTYIGPSQVPGATTVSDAAIAGIRFELATKDYQDGTYGLWNGGVLDASIGPLTFDSEWGPVIANGVPVIATLLSTLCTVTSRTDFDCSGSFVR